MYVNDDDVFLIISSLLVCSQSLVSFQRTSQQYYIDIMKDWLWYEFGLYVNIPTSELERIRSQYSSNREYKHAVIDLFISKHPAPSWTLVAHTLYKMGGGGSGGDDGVSCLKSLDLLQQLFPTGIYNNILHSVYTILSVFVLAVNRASK